MFLHLGKDRFNPSGPGRDGNGHPPLEKTALEAVTLFRSLTSYHVIMFTMLNRSAAPLGTAPPTDGTVVKAVAAINIGKAIPVSIKFSSLVTQAAP